MGFLPAETPEEKEGNKIEGFGDSETEEESILFVARARYFCIPLQLSKETG